MPVSYASARVESSTGPPRLKHVFLGSHVSKEDWNHFQGLLDERDTWRYSQPQNCYRLWNNFEIKDNNSQEQSFTSKKNRRNSSSSEFDCSRRSTCSSVSSVRYPPSTRSKQDNTRSKRRAKRSISFREGRNCRSSSSSSRSSCDSTDQCAVFTTQCSSFFPGLNETENDARKSRFSSEKFIYDGDNIGCGNDINRRRHNKVSDKSRKKKSHRKKTSCKSGTNLHGSRKEKKRSLKKPKKHISTSSSPDSSQSRYSSTCRDASLQSDHASMLTSGIFNETQTEQHLNTIKPAYEDVNLSDTKYEETIFNSGSQKLDLLQRRNSGKRKKHHRQDERQTSNSQPEHVSNGISHSSNVKHETGVDSDIKLENVSHSGDSSSTCVASTKALLLNNFDKNTVQSIPHSSAALSSVFQPVLTSELVVPPDEEEEHYQPGPQPLETTVKLTQSSVDYGGALRPGEGEAIAQFVQAGKRIPRRGEVGLTADEIESFETLGYVMSGSRHTRMNAIRIRKENQVYSAEEQRALAMYNYEERANREASVIADLREMLANIYSLEEKYKEAP